MKKIIALWGVVVMLVSLLPADYVKADTVSSVDQAKSYMDTILQAAPTAEEYVFTEALAEDVDALGKLLQGITDSDDMDLLDAYAAEKTTVTVEDPSTGQEQTVVLYQTVQNFYQAYADAQNIALAALAQPIDEAVEGVLAGPLVPADFEAAKALYDQAEKHVKAAVDADNVNAMNQLRELLELADTADRAFARISELTSESSDSEYTFFVEDVTTAKTAYGLYESKFTELRRYGKYADCLTKAMKNTLFANYDRYQKALLVYDVETAYDALGIYEVLNDTVKEKLDALQAAVDAGSTSDFSISVYDYYRGEAIHYVLAQYQNIITFEEMMAMTSETPANKTELTAALRAYRYYNEELTADEQELVPNELIQKMNNAVLLNTDCDEVIKAIEEIGMAGSDEEYEDFLARYEKAYKAYRLFVNTYSGISDIPGLITNIDRLDSATDVLEMIKSIRQLEEAEDATMCSRRLQIESLLAGYERMPQTQQTAVYNIDVLRLIYEDVKSAGDLRNRMDMLRGNDGGYSLLDSAFVKTLRQDYENLNERAKRYFGESYLSQLQAIEKELDAQNLNAALRVSTLISQIGTVNAQARDRISNARRAYDGLSAEQKAYVPNLATLQEAETAYSKLELSVAKATVSGLGSYTYSGTALKPAMTVKLGGVTLTQDIDYTLTYSSNLNVGTAKVVIQGIGYYTGSLTKTFTIRAAAITGVEISGYRAKYVYTGKAVKPSVKAVLNGRTMKKGVDYTLSYRNHKKRGTATITVKGIGNFTGSTQVHFSIVRNSVKKAKVSGVKSAYRYTGKAVRPKVKVKISGVTLKKNRDYLVSYKKNKKKGKATLTIKGKGNYAGTRKVTFKIV